MPAPARDGLHTSHTSGFKKMQISMVKFWTEAGTKAHVLNCTIDSTQVFMVSNSASINMYILLIEFS